MELAFFLFLCKNKCVAVKNTMTANTPDATALESTAVLSTVAFVPLVHHLCKCQCSRKVNNVLASVRKQLGFCRPPERASETLGGHRLCFDNHWTRELCGVSLAVIFSSHLAYILRKIWKYFLTFLRNWCTVWLSQGCQELELDSFWKFLLDVIN